MSTTRARKGDSTSELSVGVSSVSVTDVETIVAKAVTAATKVVREEFEKLFRDMSERIQQLEGRLEAVESAVETVVQDQRPNVCADIAELAGKMEAMRKETRQTALLANDAEQYSRLCNLRFRGLQVPNGADCKTVVTDFIRAKIHLLVSQDDIESAHVVPMKDKHGAAQQSDAETVDRRRNEPSTIIARFRQRVTRDKVIQNRKVLKSTNTTIVEDLTNLNVELMNRLRKHSQVDKTWSWNGRVYFTLTDGGGRKIQARPYETIQELIAKR